ncbi:MAG TPA: biotin/lipoyl-containing protein [Solirubrobacteraceae bacterium]|jgi:acetyl-CoA carboxylase biotin carboxyl carrier protein
MALTHDEVREILAIIDSSAPAEIQVQTDGFSLHVVIGDGVSSEAAAGRPTPAGTEATRQPEGLETIESPMLGTFYRAESPGSDPFVEVGSVVETDTVVCIIEVMKMMNSVTAGVAGTVTDVLPENGQLVEFGEPLFRVEPA